jgi:hypothetical protein
MRIYSLIPENSYSCQICQRELQTTEPKRIIPNIQPVCSPECQLLVIGRILQTFPNPDLAVMINYSMPNFRPKKRSDAVHKLSLWFLRKWEERQ